MALTRAVAAAGPELLPAPLLAVFQPREEKAPSGAADVVASEAFRAHTPGAVLGVHVQPELLRGVVSARPGPVNASSDEIEITVHGRAGHGGYPHRTRDPVLALAQVVVSIQQVVSRRVNPLEAGVVTDRPADGGSAPNVVPARATARGTVRSLDADRDEILAAVRDVVEHTAAAHGCTGEMRVVPNEPAVVNDERLAGAIAAALGPAAPRGRPGPHPTGLTLDTTFRSCGADDFSHYCGGRGRAAGPVRDAVRGHGRPRRRARQRPRAAPPGVLARRRDGRRGRPRPARRRRRGGGAVSVDQPATRAAPAQEPR